MSDESSLVGGADRLEEREKGQQRDCILAVGCGCREKPAANRTQHLRPTVLRLSTLYPAPGTDIESASRETMRNRLER